MMGHNKTGRNRTEDAYKLGTWIGRKQAFSALAGRCSAAVGERLCRARSQAARSQECSKDPRKRQKLPGSCLQLRSNRVTLIT